MANKYSNFQFKDYKSVFVDPQTTEIQKILRSRWDENRSRYDVLDNGLKSTAYKIKTGKTKADLFQLLRMIS